MIKTNIINTVFIPACENGDYKTASYILSSNNLSQSILNEGLISSSKYGHFNIVKSIKKIVKSDNNEAFKIACCKGYLNIAQLLYNTSIDFNLLNFCFKKASEFGHLNIVKWIYDIEKSYLKNNFHQLFLNSCVDGYIDLAKWYYTVGLGKFYLYFEKVFIQCCRHGQLEMCQWLTSVSNMPMLNCQDDEPLRISVYYNHLDIVKWLVSKGCVDPHLNDFELFKMACLRNYVPMAQWLSTLAGFKIKQIWLPIIKNCCVLGNLNIIKWLSSQGNFKISIGFLFYISCVKGGLETSKWLWSNISNQPNSNLLSFNLLFKEVCRQGKLTTAEWLFSLGGIDIHENQEELFRTCCKFGRFNIVKWLFNMGNININVKNDYAFRLACRHGHLNIVKWLFSVSLINSARYSNETFFACCKYGYLDLAKFLYSMGDVNLRKYDDYYFKMACYYKKKDLMDWMCTLCSDYFYEINDLEVYNPIFKNSLEYLIKEEKWLESIKTARCKPSSDLNLGNCLICYEKANLLSNCNHEYCVPCLFKWYKKCSEKKKTHQCPYCQKRIILSLCKVKKD